MAGRRRHDHAVQGITIYPPTRGLETQGDPFEPVKIGILIDMDLNQLLADWIDPTILAIEDAMNEGVWARSPVQLVIADARGLPRENYKKVIDGYRWLVDQGCVVVLGPMISDNSLVLQDTANELGVACIGWTGAHRFASEYCFTVANGDIPTEGVMCAQWLKAQGLEKVGLFWEAGLVRQGLRRLLPRHRAAARPDRRPRGEARAQPGRAWWTTWPRCASWVEGLYYGGYGYATFHFADALKALDWDPPRVMGTAFMFYSNSNKWAEGLEGWHGVDQLGEDGANPNYNAMIERFEKRFGRKTAQRRRRAGLRHRPRRRSTASPTPPSPPQVRQGRAREDPLDAGHQRRTRVLHPVRAVGPQGLQGRLPHHPRAPGRRAALRRLPPTRVAVERGPMTR